ncbi:MAG: hydrogenase maturation protease [Candidatus Asgardarchaeia archaeon]
MIDNENGIISFLSTYFFSNKHVIFIGLGNPLRSDDSFGIEFCKRLKKYINETYNEEDDDIEGILVDLINGTKHADVVFFVDAIDASTSINENNIILCTNDEIKYVQSSHKIPIRLYMELLKKRNIESYLIGLKPEKVKISSRREISREVNQKINKFLKNLITLLDKD